MPTNASRRPALLADAASLILLLACAALLWRLIPYAHWAAMWQDRDFTGWIGPLANRLAAANGARLYEDGFIFPMPPLAILTVLGLTQGRAVWLSETQINYAFVFAMPPLLFLIARLYCSTPRALAAALATLCAFVSLPKQMVYDAEVQFFVTLALGALALRFELAASDRGKLLAADLALALALALAILTK